MRSETEQPNDYRTPETEQPNTQNGLLFLLKREQAERERERKQLEDTIADLRQRLDSESRKVTALLTHQPQATQIPDPADPTPALSKLRQKLFGY